MHCREHHRPLDHRAAAGSGLDLVDPPLVIFVSPGEDLKPSDFPTDPMLGRPFIMFEGTPYEHLMIPVKDRDKKTTGAGR